MTAGRPFFLAEFPQNAGSFPKKSLLLQSSEIAYIPLRSTAFLTSPG